MENWAAYNGTKFDYSGDKLTTNWDKIHAGNLEPLPTDEAVLDVWRSYHQGQFAEAYEKGLAIGGDALVPAAFAITIYTQYIEPSDDKKMNQFLQAIETAEKATVSSPNNANGFYMLAVANGRYSQFINMIEALQQGVAPKIKDAVTRCLEIAPNNAEALVTFAGWHSEIADKMGSMLAGLTYGAKKELAEEYYDNAIAQAPNSPVVYIEKAHGLLLMYGNSIKDEAAKLFEQAISCEPMDAMQWMDIDKTKKYLEELPDLSF